MASEQRIGQSDRGCEQVPEALGGGVRKVLLPPPASPSILGKVGVAGQDVCERCEGGFSRVGNRSVDPLSRSASRSQLLAKDAMSTKSRQRVLAVPCCHRAARAQAGTITGRIDGPVMKVSLPAERTP